jgi:protein phosphatase 1 regulatory subunit 11
MALNASESASSATTTTTATAASAAGGTALPPSFTVHLAPVRPHLRWAASTVDNENMGKRSSKKCCIFHKRRVFGESSSDEDASDGSDCEGKKKRAAAGGGDGGGGAGGGAVKAASNSGDAVEFDPECEHCTRLAALRAGGAVTELSAAQAPSPPKSDNNATAV